MSQEQRKLTLADAMTAPAEHAFLPGHGYVKLGHPALPPRLIKQGPLSNAAPPAGTNNGTRHELQPPMKAQPMVFTWNAGHWFREKGNRIAWTPEYLAANGWSYLGPA